MVIKQVSLELVCGYTSRLPKTEKPEIIRDIHGTLMKVFNI